MQEYTITAVQRMDEWNGTYGPMVTYNVALEGEDGWIRLNQKVDTPEPTRGQSLTGKIEVVNPRDGESYRKFTKINPKYAGEQQQSRAGSQEGYIVQMLEELTGRRPVHEPEEQLQDPFPNL